MQQQRTNRDKLLDGALACLRERGYGNTSSRDIARAAGVNIASINYHFGSKDALLDDALGRCFSTWNQRVQEAFDHSRAAGPAGQILAVLEATVDSFEQIRPAVYACVESYAPALRSEALRERLAAGYADVRQHSVDLAGAALAGTRHSTAGEPVDHRLGVDGGHRWPHDPVDRRSVRHPAIDRGNPSACQHRRGRHVAVAVNHTVAGWSALRLMPTSMKPAAPSHAAVSRVGGTR